MSKKDQLKHLSDEEKILWYELHSNPTGSDYEPSDAGLFVAIAICLLVIIVWLA